MDPMGHVSTINIAMGPNPSLDEEAVERLRSESRMPSKPEFPNPRFERMGIFINRRVIQLMKVTEPSFLASLQTCGLSR